MLSADTVTLSESLCKERVKMAQRARVLVTMPDDVKRWLKETARFNGGTSSGEVVRALRLQMERAGTKQTTAPRRSNKQPRRMTANA